MSRGPKLALALETEVVQDNMPCEVFPNIYIGSIHAAFNQEALLNLGITHILNASRLPSTFPKTFTYLSIDIRDKEEANILSSIPAANIFIEAGIASGGVLVHCYGGRSRSAAFVCAFLMSSFGWPYEQAQATIYAARPVADINTGFESQLRAYIYSNYDVYVAQQVLLLGRVQALQKFRAIKGTTENELEIKANQRKKFGIKNVLSGGGGERGEGKRGKGGSSSQSSSGHSGTKRSWRSAKDSKDDEDDEKQAHEREELEEEPEDSGEEQLSRAAASVLRRDRHSSVNHDVVVGNLPSSVDGSLPLSSLRRHIPLLDPRSPRLRLSRPGSTSVRVIPPLRGLERVFCCSWCQFNLFNLASVIRTDLDLRSLRDMLSSSAEDKNSTTTSSSTRNLSINNNNSGGGGGSSKEDYQSFMEHFPEDNSPVALSSMPAPSLTMSRPRGEDKWGSKGTSSSGSYNFSDNIAPAKSFYREPPKTMRNSNSSSKSFDFDFGVSSPTPNTVTAIASSTNTNTTRESKILESDSGDQEMEIDNEEESQMHVNVSGPITTGNTHIPRLSIDSSRTRLPNSNNISLLSIPPRGHNSMIISPLESPRIPIPPNQRERSSFTYPSPRDRPQSAEKRRWLARVNLLNQGGGGDTEAAGCKANRIDKMSEDDDQAIKLGFGSEKYIHVEYLEWMGEDLLSSDIDEGELKCGHCQRVIGAWNWNPHPKHTLFGRLEPPLIRVHKNVVQEIDIPLDSTPANTPRLLEDFPSGDA